MNKELKIILASLFGVLVIAVGIYFLTNKKIDTNSESSPPELQNLVRDFNHKKGPDNAKVKIVEFYDPECESCSAFFPYVKEVLARYPNDVQLIVRYALYHGNSTLAAKASDAAGLQGKFWEFQELLFLNQGEWSHSQMPATKFMMKYAEDLSLDIKKFNADMTDLKRMETIAIDLEDGPKLGVKGTPTIFVNGKKLERIHPTDFQEMVAGEVGKNNN
jgi:protein-disulfide isomerase